jgi:hypothetical protein
MMSSIKRNFNRLNQEWHHTLGILCSLVFLAFINPSVAIGNEYRFSGGDGLSCENAVLIHGASTPEEANTAERVWLKNTFGEYSFMGNTILRIKSRMYDKNIIGTS